MTQLTPREAKATAETLSNHLTAIHQLRRDWSRHKSMGQGQATGLANALLELGHADSLAVGGGGGGGAGDPRAAELCAAEIRGQVRAYHEGLGITHKGLTECLAGMRAREKDIRRACDAMCDERGVEEMRQRPLGVTWSAHRYLEVAMEIVQMYTRELVMKTHLLHDFVARDGGGGGGGGGDGEQGRATLMRYVASWMMEPFVDVDRLDALSSFQNVESNLVRKE